MTTSRRVLILLATGVAAAALLVLGIRVAAGGADPAISGFTDGPRGGCPPTSNCVSSRATDDDWATDPLECDAPEPVVLQAVTDALGVDPDGTGAWVVRSTVFGFPDDLRVEVTDGRVDVISASRVGTSDLGVNAARVDRLRADVRADARCG